MSSNSSAWRQEVTALEGEAPHHCGYLIQWCCIVLGPRPPHATSHLLSSHLQPNPQTKIEMEREKAETLLLFGSKIHAACGTKLDFCFTLSSCSDIFDLSGSDSASLRPLCAGLSCQSLVWTLTTPHWCIRYWNKDVDQSSNKKSFFRQRTESWNIEESIQTD